MYHHTNIFTFVLNGTASQQPASWQNFRNDIKYFSGPLRMDGVGQTHPYQLFYRSAQHQIQLDLSAENTLGQK